MLTFCVLAVLSFSCGGNAAFYPGLWEEMAAELAAQRYGEGEPIQDGDVYSDANLYADANPYGPANRYGDTHRNGDTEALVDEAYGIRDGDGWGDIVGQKTGRNGVGFNGVEDPIDARNTRGIRSFREVYDEGEDGADRDAAGGADDMFHDVVARIADYIDWDTLSQEKELEQHQQQRSYGKEAGKSNAEEDIHHSHVFGSDAGDRFQYMTGGAGEGVQWLKPEGTVHNKQEVKTDRFLPAYCDPPNPCPVGFTAEDGCDPSPREKFTADYSKLYQSSQECHCDREHNYGCSASQSKNKSASKEENDLLKNNLKDLARIFSDVDGEEEKRADDSKLFMKKNKTKDDSNKSFRKNKFSTSMSNPYLVGEPLKRVAKKFPSNSRM